MGQGERWDGEGYIPPTPPLLLSSSLPLFSIPVSPFFSPPSLSPALHLSFSHSPCLPINPPTPFPPLISPALAWVTGMISLVELSTKQKRKSVLRSFSRLIWPKAAADWCVRPLSPGCLGVYSEVFVITRSRLRPSAWPMPAGAAGAWAKDESHEYTVIAGRAVCKGARRAQERVSRAASWALRQRHTVTLFL